jgi:hypothetical protein
MIRGYIGSITAMWCYSIHKLNACKNSELRLPSAATQFSIPFSSQECPVRRPRLLPHDQHRALRVAHDVPGVGAQEIGADAGPVLPV